MRWIAAVLGAAGVAGVIAVNGACQNNTDCTCTVDANGDHRVVACGDTACVGGQTFTCSDGKVVAQSGSCTVQPTPTSSTGTGVDSGPAPMDHSCDDLATFCSTSCRHPASVNSDCLSAAGSGDPAQCMAWQQSNAALCSP